MNNKKQYTTSIYVGTVNGKAQRKFIRANSQRELNKKVNALKSEVAAGKDVYSVNGRINGSMKRRSRLI